MKGYIHKKKLSSENSPTKRKGLSLKHLPWVLNGQGVPSKGTKDSAHELNLGTLSGPCKRSQGHMVAF